MGEQIKNMMVGFVMIAACAFTIALILFLKPSEGDRGKTYYLRFSNINGIGEGTRVLFAGRPVGEVTSIQEIIDARKQPSDDMGRTYFYQLTISVDSSVTIYSTDEISIQTTGLLGEKSIAIIPKAPGKNVIPQAVGTEPIYAGSSDPLETAFSELSDLANKMQSTFSYLNDILEENKETISGAITSFKSTLDQADQALTQFNQSGIIEEAKQGITKFTSAMGRVDTSLQELEQGQFFPHMADIARALSQGEGTLGKLIVNEDMYLKFSALLSKANTMMNDINQYGILFHLNKTWQRDRLQRVTLINSLDTPETFKEYFTQEVDSVNLALERLSLLLDKAQTSPEKQKIFQNSAFTQDFAEFLREVNALADHVKLYNEELQEVSKN
ncbi:MAG: MCE family protein [Chlamydiae bacterium]|nr:MCE family protein [Chlamydiota bacterium]